MYDRLDCNEIQDLLDYYIRGELDDKTAKLVEEHLSGCPECRELCSDMESVSRAVSESGYEFPEGLHNSIMSSVRAEKAAESTRARRNRLRRIAGIGAAAVICLSVGLVALTRHFTYIDGNIIEKEEPKPGNMLVITYPEYPNGGEPGYPSDVDSVHISDMPSSDSKWDGVEHTTTVMSTTEYIPQTSCSTPEYTCAPETTGLPQEADGRLPAEETTRAPSEALPEPSYTHTTTPAVQPGIDATLSPAPNDTSPSNSSPIGSSTQSIPSRLNETFVMQNDNGKCVLSLNNFGGFRFVSESGRSVSGKYHIRDSLIYFDSDDAGSAVFYIVRDDNGLTLIYKSGAMLF